MHQLFSLPASASFAIALVFGLILTAASIVLLRLVHGRLGRRADAVPVPTFIGTVTTAWALALGFAAADVWSINNRAEQVASAERSSINRLAGMASAEALDAPALLEALRNYAAASAEHEWKASGNSRPAAEVDETLQQIRLEIVRMAFADAPNSLIGKMTVDFDELQDARNERLGIGAGSVSEYKWYLVLFLTFLSQASIAFVHADRLIGGRNAILIFTTASTVSLWILALYANPYLGVAGISPEKVHSLVQGTVG